MSFPTFAFLGTSYLAFNFMTRGRDYLGGATNEGLKSKLEILISHLALLSTLRTKAQYLTWMVTFVSASYRGRAYDAIREHVVALVRAQLFTQSGEECESTELTEAEVSAFLDRLYAHFEDEAPQVEVAVSEPLGTFFDCETLEKCVAFMSDHPDGDISLPLDMCGLDVGAFTWHLQAGFVDVQEGFSTGVDIFKAVRHTPYYVHARKVIAMCFSASVLSESLLKAHPWFHKRLFAGLDYKEGVDPVDLIDEVLDLSNAVMRAAAQCVLENSIGPLLGRGVQAVTLDTEHAWLKSHIDFYKNGLLQTVTSTEGEVVSDQEFFGRVDAHLRNVKTMHSTSRGAERYNLAAKLNAASVWLADVNEILSRASSRIEPYMVCLQGRTGQGKTVRANLIAKHLLQCNGYAHTQEYLAQVDPDSNFYDSITNKTLGVFIDDLANTLPQFAKSNELMTLIRLKNTSNVPVNKASLEDKGRTFHQCRVVVASTNAPMLGADVTQVEHSAILRRFDAWVIVTTKPGFERDFEADSECRPLKMLDPAKLVDGIYTDAQEFTFRKWVPLETTAGSTRADTGMWVTQRDEDGTVLDKVSYNRAMRYMARHSAAHFAHQQKLRDAYKLDETLPICPHGGTTAPFCPDCRRAEEEARARVGELEVQGGAPSREWSGVQEPAPSPVAQFFDRVDSFILPTRTSSREERVQVDSPQSPVESDEFSISSDAEEVVLTRAESMHRMYLSAKERATVLRCRVSRAWDSFANAPQPELEPRILGLMKAWSNGKFDLEEIAVIHFDKVMTGLCCVAPLVATASSGLLACFGFGYFWLTAAWVGVFMTSTRTLVATARAWVAGRIAGETLAELKRRSMEIVGRYMGALGVLIMVLGLVKGTLALLRRNALSGEKTSTPACAAPATGVDALGEQGGAGSLHEPIEKQNVWEKRAVATWYSLSPSVKTMTAEQILAAMQKQLFVMEIHYQEQVVTSNCLAVATNYMVAPAHNFLRSTGEWSKIVKIVLRKSLPAVGPSYTFKVCPEQMYRLSGDMMLVQTNAGGSMPDVLDLIADGEPVGAIPITELYRKPVTCDVEVSRYMVTPDWVSCNKRGWRYKGFTGIRGDDTFRGLCGALVVAGMRYPKIVAIHTMGSGRLAASCRLSVTEIRDGIAMLSQTALTRVRVVTQPTTELYVPLGMEHMGEIGPLAENSVLREAPDGLPIKPYGSLVNYKQIRAKSRLGPSPYAKLVSKVCEMPIEHGPPKNIGKATVEKAKLAEMAEAGCLPVEDMLLARRDLKDEIVALGTAIGFWPQLRVLTKEEAAAGVPGVSTIRSVNLKTAAGFPYVGPKRNLMEHCPMDGLPDAFVLDEGTSAELDRVIKKMEGLERPNFVFKGSHKDEPTKLTKEKVRVFEGSPLVMTMVVRMYILPILRMMMLAREQSCSAVGIDATSHEWHTLHEHVRQYNPTEAVIGDWRHYDTSEFYAEMMTVFSILIEVTEEYGSYTEKELCVMTVACEEIARHITLLRGDIAECEGSNPSGQGATVDLNNGVGGLRFRCAFYNFARQLDCVQPVERWEMADMPRSSGGFTIAPGARLGLEPLLPNLTGRFADYARCSFYGDDFKSAVKPVALPWYNQVTLCAYFAKHGLDLTDAHKNPLTEPTIPWSEVTFLKRGFRWEERVQAYQGPLEMGSIYKSLFVWPKVREMDDEAHLAECIANAIRELYQHGEEVFNARVPPLLEVAERAGVAGLLIDVPIIYEQLENVYKAKRLASRIAVAELDFGTE